MYFTAIQAAAIIVAQTTFAKLAVSLGLRVSQQLALLAGKTQADLDKLEAQDWVQRLRAAQLNEAEYSPLFVALLLFAYANGNNDIHTAGTVAAASQVGYFWSRITIGYPAIPTVSIALVRYGALIVLGFQLYQEAF